MGEFERIARLRRAFAAEAPDVALGIGDDAAVLRAGADVVLSVDVVVEGTHFRRRFADEATLARRAAMAALSDLAAMGAEATALLCAWVLPAELEEAAFDGLVAGTAAAAREVGAVVVGGNLARGPGIALTTTAVGRAERVIRRDGARPGDGLFVTGEPGAAALGLAALLAGREDEALLAPFVEAWRRPRAHLAEGRALAREANACIDLSDGLLPDLGHVCAASGVGALIEPDALPCPAGFGAAAAALGEEPERLQLVGGEVYGLLFTAPEGAKLPAGATRIGTIEATPGIRLCRGDAVEPAPEAGLDHFGG